MIGRLTGILIEKNPPQITMDVHGVGYEVDVPISVDQQSFARDLQARAQSLQLDLSVQHRNIFEALHRI